MGATKAVSDGIKMREIDKHRAEEAWKPAGTLEEAERFSEESAIRQTLYAGTILEDYLSLEKTGWNFSNSWFENSDERGRQGQAVYLYTHEEDARKWARSARIPEGQKGVYFSVKVCVNNPARLKPGEASILTVIGTKSLVGQLKDEGYDSAVYFWSGPHDQVLVFNPRNVMIIKGSAVIEWPIEERGRLGQA
jgi:hypothetical protein